MNLGRRFFSLFLFLSLLFPLYADNADNLYKTAVESIKDGFFLNAANSLKKFINLYPEDRRIESAYFLFAVSNYYLKNYRMSIKILSDLLTSYPNTKYKNSSNYWIGLSYYKLEDYRNSASYFKRQISKYSNNRDYLIKAQYYEASALEKIGENRDALSLYATVIENSKDTAIKAASVFAAGALEFKGENYSKALKYFKQLIINYPNAIYSEDALFFSAECSFFLRRNYDAEKRYSRLLTLYPKSRYRETAYYRLASVLMDLNEKSESFKYIVLYENTYPKGRYNVEVWKLKAINLFDSGDFKNSKILYKKIAALEPEGIEKQKDLYNIALCSINTGDNREALRYLKLCLNGKDNLLNEKALYREGEVLVKLGKNTDAADIFALFIEKYPESKYKTDAAKKLGALYDSSGDYRSAITVWGNLINGVELSREMDSFLYSRGSDYIKVHDYTSAIRDFSRIISRYRESSFLNRAHYQLGYIYSLKGEYKRALGYFLPLTELDNSDPELKEKAEFAAASAYFNLGEYEKSETHFRKMASNLKDAELSGEAVLNIGRIKYKQQKYAEAAAYFKKAHSALEDTDDGVEALYWAGWAQFREGDIKHARDSFLEVVKKYPDSRFTASSYYRAGLCAFKLKAYSKSIKYYNSALALDRGTKSGSVREAALAGRGISEFYAGREKEALVTLKTLKKEFPHSKLAAEGYFEIGEYLFNKKLYKDALLNFSTVIEDFPNSADSETASFWIGKSLFMLKRYREAVDSFFKYLKDYPNGSYSNETANLVRDSLIKINDADYADSVYRRILKSKGMSDPSKSRLLLEYAVYKFPLNIDISYKTLEMLRAMPLDNTVQEETDFWIAKYYKEKGSKRKAADIFKGIADAHSNRIGAESQMDYAKILESLGEKEKAIEAYLGLTYVFKEYNDLVAEALYRALELYRSIGNTKQVEYLSKKLKFNYPESRWTKKIKRKGS